jgi:hypothetical protein
MKILDFKFEILDFRFADCGSISNLKSKISNSSSGFTLVETALALVAIGVGLIALFGLGRLALESSRESENDRRCAVMADAVFETLRAVNQIYVDEARTNGFMTGQSDTGQWQSDLWHTLWEQGGEEGGGTPQLSAPLPSALWGDTRDGVRLLFPPVANMSTNNVPLIYSAQTMDFNLVNTWPAYDVNNVSLADRNPRYPLSIGHIPTYRYYSPVSGNYTTKQVTLIIYPDGNVGSSDPRIFTTTLSNSGGMQ